MLHRGFVAALAVSVLLTIVSAHTSQPATAEPVDKVGEELARQRVRYEAAMEQVRQQVDQAINAKISELQHVAKVDADAVSKAIEEKKSFQASGSWPSVINVSRMRSSAGVASKGLQTAFAKAMAAYATSNNTKLSDTIKAELDIFNAQNDVVPWSDNLVADTEQAAREITPGGKLLEST